MGTRKKEPEKSNSQTSEVQGEGDYKSNSRYVRDVKHFVETHDVEKAARDAAPRSDQESHDLEVAENAGRARSKTRKPEDDRQDD